MEIPLLSEVTGFDWDEHNREKNQTSHQVEQGECEELFFNQPLVIKEDMLHSGNENRFHALGITDAGRRLLIVFTVRGDKIRVISARDMSRRERAVYENY